MGLVSKEAKLSMRVGNAIKKNSRMERMLQSDIVDDMSHSLIEPEFHRIKTKRDLEVENDTKSRKYIIEV